MTEAAKFLPSKNLLEVIEQVLISGKLTRKAQIYLKAAAWSEVPLSADEQEAIREVFDRLQKGWVKVID